MALHGLDRAGAPEAAKAKAMLDEINGTWWNVYIGGPRRNKQAASWTPDRVRQYKAQGITRFLLIYVGRQVLPPKVDDSGMLTTAQGRRDGDEACDLAAQFGFGAGTPICLDVERSTFDASPQGSLDYACSWCQAVRDRGLRPGVYANRKPVEELARRTDRPDWVWVTSFVRNTVDSDADPHRIPRLKNDVFSEPGQRAWQYGAVFNGKPAMVGGLDVDINVADSACIAGAVGAAPPPGGLSAAEAQGILKRMEEIFHALREGTDTNMDSLKNIRGHVVDVEAEVKALKAEVEALKDAHSDT
jgi:Rv2525c-like, glycoside hydrolase-like domain